MLLLFALLLAFLSILVIAICLREVRDEPVPPHRPIRSRRQSRYSLHNRRGGGGGADDAFALQLYDSANSRGSRGASRRSRQFSRDHLGRNNVPVMQQSQQYPPPPPSGSNDVLSDLYLGDILDAQPSSAASRASQVNSYGNAPREPPVSPLVAKYVDTSATYWQPSLTSAKETAKALVSYRQEGMRVCLARPSRSVENGVCCSYLNSKGKVTNFVVTITEDGANNVPVFHYDSSSGPRTARSLIEVMRVQKLLPWSPHLDSGGGGAPLNAGAPQYQKLDLIQASPVQQYQNV